MVSLLSPFFLQLSLLTDAPEPILSTLRGLGETLTVYVTGTTWDKQFRLTLVSSVLPVNYNFENTEFHCSNDQVRSVAIAKPQSFDFYSIKSFNKTVGRYNDRSFME